MQPTRFVAAAAALSTVIGCSSMGPTGISGSSSPAAASLTAADANFIAQAAYGGWGEIALGKLAQNQASSPAVREFGAMMVTDHTKANRDLAAIAKAHGISPPTMPDPGRQAVATALDRLSGPAFDRQYVQQQIADHELSMVLFDNEANNTMDPDLRSFARTYAPVIRQHYTMLRSLSLPAMSSR
jgi:putative membrane protein